MVQEDIVFRSLRPDEVGSPRLGEAPCVGSVYGEVILDLVKGVMVQVHDGKIQGILQYRQKPCRPVLIPFRERYADLPAA